ncbi:MAG: four helix bundle protein [Myxococcales bacterium]|nr:four helix bundle protein [Myxococcales bacterium]
MGLIIQQRALQAAGGLCQVLPVVRKRDRSLFDQIHRAMNSVVLNIAEADGNDAGTARARFASACGSAKEVRAGLQLAVIAGHGKTRDTGLRRTARLAKVAGGACSLRPRKPSLVACANPRWLLTCGLAHAASPPPHIADFSDPLHSYPFG